MNYYLIFKVVGNNLFPFVCYVDEDDDEQQLVDALDEYEAGRI